MGNSIQRVAENKQESNQVEEKQLVDQLFKEKKLYEESTKNKRTEIKNIYSAYKGKMEDKAYPWKSNKFIPKIRTEASYILPFIFSGDPELEVTGVGEEDRFIAKVLNKIVNYRLNESIEDSCDKILSWVQQGAVFGTSLLQVDWKFETKKVKEIKRYKQPPTNVFEKVFGGKVVEEEVEVEKVVKDEPCLIVPNILDTYWNPLVGDVNDQESIIVRSVLSVSSIKNNPAYKNTDKLTDDEASSFKQDEYNSEQLNSSDLNETETLQQGMNQLEVFERRSNDKIVTVADGENQVLLREKANQYGFIPFVKFVFEEEPIPNRFAGVGVGQNTIDLQALYYDLFNQIMDNLKNLANKMYKVKRGANINPKQLVSRPAGFVEVDQMDDVQELVTTDVKQTVFDIIGKVDDEHKRASGANDLIQGAESGDTASQDNLRQSNSTSRFDLVRKRFKRSLAQVGKMIIKMELENLQSPDAPILRIFPKEHRQIIYRILKSVAPEIAFNVKVKGETILSQNKDIVSKQLIDLYNLSVKVLAPKEHRAFLRKIMELRGIDGIDELVAEEPPVEEMPDPGMEPGPVDGREVPPINSQSTQQGVNQAVYGQ